jgi:formate dehydrogenase major subunit
MYLHQGGQFATPDGRGIVRTSHYHPPTEVENPDYPLTLCTVREVGHYSARTMTGNCRTLRNLEDEPGWIEMSPGDCRSLGISANELVKVTSKRGSIITRCLPTDRVRHGAVYMTYQWWIGACNELTISSLDPTSRTPEYKYCAAKVERIEDQTSAENEVKRFYSDIRSSMRISNEVTV